ncbi:MAG: DUF4835 family protein [Candidatus Delongbacteria bacterium]|nr:DUF4835 family protein [Candidatus Delongbacteria bacterium]
MITGISAMRLFILFVSALGLFAGTIDFTVKVIYLKPDKKDIMFKINAFSNTLEKQMDNYNWKVPHDDFEKIETNISVNIEKSVTVNSFSGLITVSSGPITDSKFSVALKKDIYFNEQEINFTLDYENDPQLDKTDPNSIETIIRFYANLALGENFDRLSYTDQKNFRLEGDYYFQKLYEFENILTNATERKEWNKRLEIINNYRLNKNIDIRKLNAFIYNSVYFINVGKKERAKYFIEPMYEIISNLTEIPESFFLNNFYAFGEIFSLSKDEKYLNFLIEKDTVRESYYSGKKPKQTKSVIEPDKKK